MIRFYSKAASLAIVLLTTNHNLSSTNALVSVCGSTYDDASLNCKEANPLCPTGDGCPADKPTCFGVTDDQCFSPTDAPTAAPLHICAATYDEAIANCQTNDQCPNSDTTLCSDETHACFTVSTFLCPSAGTPSPTATSSTSNVQDDSNADDSGSVPEDIKVCGTDYNDAAQNFCTNQRCPSLDGCEIGGCFTLPYMECSKIEDSPGVEMTTTTPATESEGPPTLIDVTQAVESCTPGGACSEAGSSCSDGTETCCGQTYPSLQCDCTDNGNGVLEYMCMATDSCMLPSCCQDSPPIGMPPPSEGTCDSMGDACDTDIEDDYCCFDFSGSGSESYCTKSGGKMLTVENTTTTTTMATADVIEPPTADTTTPVPTPSNSSDVFTSAPVYNRFFCGATYELAEKNCLTAQPCPTQVGCTVPGEACFGISMERCMSSSPTDSPSEPDPTISPKPSQPSATKAPSANTFYCGGNYTDAINQCVACPSGFSTDCPDGMSCFNGVQCSSTSTLAPTPESTPLDETATSATDPVVVTDETTTTLATNGVSVGSTTTTVASSISGGDDLPEVLCCAGPNCPDDSTPCADLVAESTDFDPSNTLYCGVDYNDAKDNCYERTPCPSGFKTDCPDDQSCFPITSCETPPPTVSASPTNVGGSDATSPPTPSPSKSPVSAKPSWNLDDFNTDAATGDSGALSMTVSSIMRTLLLCSVVLAGALML